MALLPHLHKVADRVDLTADEAEAAMGTLLDGTATTPQIAAFLTALRMKGETVDEVYGFARAMRSRAAVIEAPDDGTPLVDTCGTGGDGCHTFNISTVTAFVLAGCGVRVAKHGNRSISSRCGSADVLEALGVNVDLTPAQMSACLREVGIAFLYAPNVHAAVRHVQPARRELGLRTVFNLLGPLTNPARATVQLVGAPSPRAARLMADVLSRFGDLRALVVHGSDGLDEITLSGPTLAYRVQGREVHEEEITPEMFGLPRAPLSALQGGDAPTNAALTHRILSGEPGPPRDIVLLNTAAALLTANLAPTPTAALSTAALSLDTGRAASALTRLSSLTEARAA